ncbi:MAG: alkaline phosphatase family protein [Pirellulales bacterium]
MPKHVFLLSIPGLRAADVDQMPRLRGLVEHGDQAALTPSFPAVTWPVEANMLTGKLPAEHGIVANGLFWRERRELEMWTAWNDKIQQPQIWDLLKRHRPELTSAAWFPMLSKGSGAHYVCMPAPVHNPDGSESLWCYTQPTEMYGQLRDALGHFPLKHFWGPLAGIPSTRWIVDSAQWMFDRHRPEFVYIYLPHLDYQAQKMGPDSPTAQQALQELDGVLGTLFDGVHAALGDQQPLWLIASEYTIVPVDHVCYPNRLLRDAGLLKVTQHDDGQQLDLTSPAWALVDHQFSHVFVDQHDPATIRRVIDLFRGQPGIAEVLAGDDLRRYHIDHPRSGDVILISEPNSWQAYYFWTDDAHAPRYARTVDIHRKPGYDPVELHFDMATRSIPLNADLVRGSHGAPATRPEQRGVLLASHSGQLGQHSLVDTDVAQIVLRQFGLELNT